MLFISEDDEKKQDNFIYKDMPWLAENLEENLTLAGILKSLFLFTILSQSLHRIYFNSFGISMFRLGESSRKTGIISILRRFFFGGWLAASFVSSSRDEVDLSSSTSVRLF